MSFYECTTCRALFRQKDDFKAHLKSSPNCQVHKQQQRDPHAFTAELGCRNKIKSATLSATVPDTFLNNGGRLPFRPANRDHRSSGRHRAEFQDDTLLGAMEDGMKKTVSSRKKSGLDVAVLSSIAEGDNELVAAYKKLSIDPHSGKKVLTSDIVKTTVFKAKMDAKRVAAKFSRVQNVSICFVLDTTKSMTRYIKGVKDQIVEIVTNVHASNCGIAGLAFVGYSDWCAGADHFQTLQFTNNINTFKKFVTEAKVINGNDIPEDVIGGLSQALKLQWPESSGSRILLHLADAPPHGGGLYHNHRDDYPNGHPKDRTLSDLFKEMRLKELGYFFGKINKECDKMIEVFEPYYGSTIDTLDSSKVSTLSDDVTLTVMRTVSSSSESSLSTIRTAGSSIRKFRLIKNEPDWSKIPTVVATVMSHKLPETISFITSFAMMEDVVRKCNAQIASHPFTKGGIRLVYHGRVTYNSPPMKSDRVVFKEMITLPKVIELDRQRYMADLEVQTVASKLAFEFNDRLSKTNKDPNMRLKFLRAKVVRFDNEDGKPPRFMAYEKHFRGEAPEFVKYTNNMDFVRNPGTLDAVGRTCVKLAVAFSHFSYSITDGYLLVCDIQGTITKDKKGKPTLLLTDPAIHCHKHLRFGKTNWGAKGFNTFFAKHQCNVFCDALGLKMPTTQEY